MRAIGIRGRDASNRARRIRALLAGTALSALTTLPAAAQNATWLNPATVAGPTLGTFDYDAAANWTPGTPVALTNGPTGTATFGVSTTAALSFSANTTVGAWTFNAGASNYTFTNAHVLTFSGGGISVLGGSASITNSNFVIFNNGTAGNAAIVNNGTVTFNTLSSAGNATITTSGLTEFLGASTGGAAQFNTLSGGTVDISGLSGTFFATGSIEGAGSYTLGSKSLLTTNNVDTVVSGVISGVGGRLNKFGTGTLTLSGVNTYTGVTGVGGGTLIVAAGGSIASAPAVVDTGGTLIVNGTAGGFRYVRARLRPCGQHHDCCQRYRLSARCYLPDSGQPDRCVERQRYRCRRPGGHCQRTVRAGKLCGPQLYDSHIDGRPRRHHLQRAYHDRPACRLHRQLGLHQQ